MGCCCSSSTPRDSRAASAPQTTPSQHGGTVGVFATPMMGTSPNMAPTRVHYQQLPPQPVPIQHFAVHQQQYIVAQQHQPQQQYHPLQQQPYQPPQQQQYVAAQYYPQRQQQHVLLPQPHYQQHQGRYRNCRRSQYAGGAGAGDYDDHNSDGITDGGGLFGEFFGGGDCDGGDGGGDCGGGGD